MSDYDERGGAVQNQPLVSEPQNEGGDSNNDNELDPMNDPDIKAKKRKRRLKKRRCCQYG